jgi:WD40 repeat protein
VWSPDGSRIAFFSTRSGRYQIWSVSADGSGLRQISEESLSSPIWSPARDKLAVVGSMAERAWSLLDLGTGKRISTPQLPGATPDMAFFLPLSWSPDGAFIAGVRAESQRSAGEKGGELPVFIYCVRDRTYRPVDASGGVLWMSDSRRLLVYDNTTITIVDTQTGRRKVLRDQGDRQGFNQFWRVSLTRDNSRIAVVSDEVEGNLWTIRHRYPVARERPTVPARSSGARRTN